MSAVESCAVGDRIGLVNPDSSVIYCSCVSCQHDNWCNLSISSVEGIVISVIMSAVESCAVGD